MNCLGKKGFTLIEILIVVVIIAIVTTIVIVVINPAKLMSKSRDSQRFADVTSIATAINLYMADNRTLTVAGPYLSTDGATDNGRKKNDGTGWIPIDFTKVSSGAPLAALPVDPINNGAYHYTFGANASAKTYELDCVFEHSDNTPKHTADGGNNDSVYEVGTDLTILP